MRRVKRMFSLLLLLLCAGCAREPRERAVVLVNASAVDAVLLERIRLFAESELHVPVRAVEQPRLARHRGRPALEKAIRRLKRPEDVILIALAGINGETRHLTTDAAAGIALINTLPLYSDDGELFARRVERQVMRAAAFAVGLPPTPDPFCVTRDYRTLEDLDRMGRNFSPPWQGRFADEAARRGLPLLSGGGQKGEGPGSAE